ncbi:MAG: NUDIX hydrolase [Eubacterium sp.]|nr:NUDIX hydrolase [Eubacterium sp.]
MENTELERLKETKISSEEIYDGKLLHLEKDIVSLPNNNKASRELIRHVGAVCVVPLLDNGDVIIEKQYRYPVEKVITEIPAGKLESKSEDRLDAAKRELREETGYTALKWTDIGTYYPAAAYSDEKITMYLAEDLHKGERNLDDDEFLDVITMPLKEIVDKILCGEIADGKTQAAILKVDKILSERN